MAKVNTNVSTLSKKYKSQERKWEMISRNKSNGSLRASLHQEKANTSDVNKRAVIQRQIDAISQGKGVTQ